jgi:hypothetical protein
MSTLTRRAREPLPPYHARLLLSLDVYPTVRLMLFQTATGPKLALGSLPIANG